MGHRFTKYRFAAKNSDLEKMGGREEKNTIWSFYRAQEDSRNKKNSRPHFLYIVFDLSVYG